MFRFVCVFIVSSCTLFMLPEYAHAKTITVTISAVTDGDSLRAGPLRLRLFGIDAPEIDQSCQDSAGVDYACGVRAQKRMTELAPIGATLRCLHLDTDRYKRLIVRCNNENGDIAQQLVLDGLAIAYRYYSKRYVSSEMAAKAAKKGMWNGVFQDPYDYRKNRRKIQN